MKKKLAFFYLPIHPQTPSSILQSKASGGLQAYEASLLRLVLGGEGGLVGENEGEKELHQQNLTALGLGTLEQKLLSITGVPLELGCCDGL